MILAKGHRPLMLLFWLLAILWTAFIWSNSAKPAAESAEQSLRILELVEGFLVSLGVVPELLHKVVRKAAHVAEFAILGFLWSFGFKEIPGFTGRSWASLSLLICLLTALADETIQLSYPGRSGQITDLWVDLAGVALGMVGMLLLCRICRDVKKRKEG